MDIETITETLDDGLSPTAELRRWSGLYGSAGLKRWSCLSPVVGAAGHKLAPLPMRWHAWTTSRAESDELANLGILTSASALRQITFLLESSLKRHKIPHHGKRIWTLEESAMWVELTPDEA